MDTRSCTSSGSLRAGLVGLALLVVGVGPVPTAAAAGLPGGESSGAGVVAAGDLTTIPLGQAGGEYQGPVDSRGRTLAGFVGGLSGELNRFWGEALAASGVAYPPPPAVWVHGHQSIVTACGGRPIRGPGHCGRDSTVYLYAPFFEDLWRAEKDFAVVTVIAHEWAHHVQNQLRVRVWGVERELQADCMAGMFGAYSQAQGWLEDGDVEEALAISAMSGDVAHGSGRQRAAAFLQGFRGEGCTSFG